MSFARLVITLAPCAFQRSSRKGLLGLLRIQMLFQREELHRNTAQIMAGKRPENAEVPKAPSRADSVFLASQLDAIVHMGMTEKMVAPLQSPAQQSPYSD